jgi:hypothetical protein
MTRIVAKSTQNAGAVYRCGPPRRLTNRPSNHTLNYCYTSIFDFTSCLCRCKMDLTLICKEAVMASETPGTRNLFIVMTIR